MGSTNIFNRLSNQFDKNRGNDQPERLTRYMGGHNRTNHPYVSGYWQLYIDVPNLIFAGGGDAGADDMQATQEWMHSTAEGFTPPNRTINKADVPGQGGLGSSFVTGQTLTRTFTLTFREYQALPMSEIFQRWTAVIDPYTGVSPLQGNQWLPHAYKGNAFIVQTKPVGASVDRINADMIEQVWLFHGIFPEGDGGDALASDIATNDVTQLSITFSFDGWPLTKADPTVVEKALEHINWDYHTTYDNYDTKQLVKNQSNMYATEYNAGIS